MSKKWVARQDIQEFFCKMGTLSSEDLLNEIFEHCSYCHFIAQEIFNRQQYELLYLEEQLTIALDNKNE